MLFKNTISCATAAALALSVAAVPATAQDDDNVSFSLDLNNVANTEQGGCRLTYVAANNTGQALSAVTYQVAIFDAQGIVTDLLVLAFGALTDGKTTVSLFEIPGRTCTDISRITVNQVAECTLTDGTTGDFCLSSLETSSRSTIQFGI